MTHTKLTFEQALTEVRAEDAQFEEYREPWERLLVVPGAFQVGELTLQLEGDALDRVCSRVGAPASYIEKLPQDVQTYLLNHHLRAVKNPEQVVSVFANSGRVISLGRGDLHRFPSEEVLQAARAGSGRREADLDVTNLQLDDGSMQIDLVSRVGSSEVTPGDIIEAGVRIKHSSLGDFATTVEAFALRLVCHNGMIHRDCLGTRQTPRTRRLPATHPGAPRLQFDQIRRLTDEAWQRIELRLQSFHELTRQPADFGRMTATWLQRARLSAGRYIPHLERAWEAEGGEATLYGVMNAFTRAANFEDVPARVRTILSRLGGLIAFQSRHLCPRCFALAAESS
jgi:hypothetical protein